MAKVRWLKTNHEELYKQVDLTITYVSDSEVKTRVGLTPAEQNGKWLASVFMPKAATYISAHNAWSDPSLRTPAVSKRFRQAEKEMIEVFQVLHGMLVASPFVTDEDLERMEMPARNDGERHPSKKAGRAPGFRFEQLDGHRVQIDFHDVESESKRGKPDGQHGIEMKIGVFKENRKVTIAELTESVFDTNPPYIFEGTDTQQGDFLMVCGRWENTRGEKGPWSEVFVIVIP